MKIQIQVAVVFLFLFAVNPNAQKITIGTLLFVYVTKQFTASKWRILTDSYFGK